MFSKLILSASSIRLVAGHWRFGRFLARAAFDSGEEGRNNFRRYLQQYSNTPVYLMVDAAEEDFRIETMPHSSGTARREMVARKFGQHYRNVKYRAAQFLGREENGRKDDRFLFMALNSSDSITPWLQLIEERQLPVAGIYLLPTVSQFLLEEMKLKLPHLLLLTRQSTGMRQIYFRNGKLCFSRTISIAGLEECALAETVADETEKTRRHLLGQRLIDFDTRIKLMPVGLEKFFCQQLDSKLHGLEMNAMGQSEIASHFELEPAYLDQFPELMHMQVLARHVPKANLADAMQVRPFIIHRLRHAFYLGGVAILLGGTAFTIYWLSQAADYDRQRVLARERIASQEVLNRRVAGSFAQTRYSGNELKAAVELAQRLEHEAKSPYQLMTVVSGVLDSFPEFKLNHLRWTLSEHPVSAESGDPVRSDEMDPPPLKFSKEDGRRLYVIGIIEGEVSNFSGDSSAAFEYVTGMAELFRKNKAVKEVAIVPQPVSTGSFASLQGNVLDEQAQQLPVARFKLRIMLNRDISPDRPAA